MSGFTGTAYPFSAFKHRPRNMRPGREQAACGAAARTAGFTLVAALIVLALSLSGCTTLSVPAPEGFAPLVGGNSGSAEYAAVSPEGMKYRVRTEENYPSKDLDFWSRTLSLQLEKEGYRRVGEEMRFSASGKDGVVFEWGVPYGNETYIYLTALIVYPQTIVIAEAAAETAVYEAYREAILKSLEGIAFRKP